MVGWHHRRDGHEFEETPGVGDGQGSLACCSPWGHKELDMTEQLNWSILQVCSNNRLVPNRKRSSSKAVYCHPTYLTHMQSTS